MSVITEAPSRVATVDGNGDDNILALGLQPATIDVWYGVYENGLWPWASPLLQTEPVLLERGVLDFEAIAASDPDVILSLYNAMSPEEYQKLYEAICERGCVVADSAYCQKPFAQSFPRRNRIVSGFS